MASRHDELPIPPEYTSLSFTETAYFKGVHIAWHDSAFGRNNRRNTVVPDTRHIVKYRTHTHTHKEIQQHEIVDVEFPFDKAVQPAPIA